MRDFKRHGQDVEIVTGKVVVRGTAEGAIEGTTDMLSFWGGYDPKTGKVIDRHHSLFGKKLTSKVVAMPSGKGSSTGSPVLLDALVSNRAPAGLLMKKADEIISLGVIVYEEFYGKTIPIIVLDELDFTKAVSANRAEIKADGTVLLRK